MNQIGLWALLVLAVLNGLLLRWVIAHRGPNDGQLADRLAQDRQCQELMLLVRGSAERTERELRREIGESARSGRQELTQNLATFQLALVQQGTEATRTQNTQIDAFGQQLALLQKTLSDTLTTQLSGVSEANAWRMSEIRQTLEAQIAQLQNTNSAESGSEPKSVDPRLPARMLCPELGSDPNTANACGSCCPPTAKSRRSPRWTLPSSMPTCRCFVRRLPKKAKMLLKQELFAQYLRPQQLNLAHN